MDILFKVVQTTLSNNIIHNKMSINMFLLVVFVFQSVVFILEKEIDLLQQHMTILPSTSRKPCQL